MIDFLAQSLTVQQLFRDLPLSTILQSDLTIGKNFESQILTSKINYLIVRFEHLLD
jgi:hypothetical protein